MRFVTFNVKHAVGDAVAADVLALQELDVRVPRTRFIDQAAAWARVQGMQVAFGHACRVGGMGRYGNALLARSPLHDVAVATLPRIGRREVRSALLARVDGVSVAATHLSIHDDESARQLDAVLDALLARPGPWVLLGDLNRSPHQLDAVTAAGLALADPSVPTFPAHAPDRRIDHVAVGGGLMVESVAVLPRQRVSDHRPLAVDIAHT